MKLCTDCRYYRAGRSRYDDLCAHPQLQEDDLVRGGRMPKFCTVQREAYVRCGTEGKLFERRPLEAA